MFIKSHFQIYRKSFFNRGFLIGPRTVYSLVLDCEHYLEFCVLLQVTFFVRVFPWPAHLPAALSPLTVASIHSFPF